MTAITTFLASAFANVKSNATAFVWGAGLAPILMFFREHVFGDLEFAFTLAVVVCANALLALFADIWLKKAWHGSIVRSLVKGSAYLLVLIVFHNAASHTVNGVPNVLYQWLDAAIYGGILLAELLQCIESAGRLGVVVPKFVTARLRAFDESGNPLATPSTQSDPNTPTQPTV